jgi:hypothetical protein
MSHRAKRIDVPCFGEIAQQLVTNGYQPIPLAFDDKIPVVKDWPNYRFDQSKLDRYSRSLVFMRRRQGARANET